MISRRLDLEIRVLKKKIECLAYKPPKVNKLAKKLFHSEKKIFKTERGLDANPTSLFFSIKNR